MARFYVTSALLAGLLLTGCGSPPRVELPYPNDLRDFGFFEGDGSSQQPREGVVRYELNTQLFSDYASKFRFLKLPEGTAATYASSGPLDFPVGTAIAKTFAHPDASLASGFRLLETRVLLHTEDQGWIGLPYVWNEAQTRAELRIAGEAIDVAWSRGTEQIEHTYRVPNMNQCKGCHRVHDRVMEPIGPRAGQLNRIADYDGKAVNQLTHLAERGLLTDLPPLEQVPRTPTWDDPASGSLEDRARAWIDINCAHCHNPEGPARTSGLDLREGGARDAHVAASALGVYKTPVAAGKGSGDRLYSIVPGDPDASILVYRLESLDPGVMMPELGRSLIDREGLALVREWIAAMPRPSVVPTDLRESDTTAGP